jgi:predicted phage tail protein
MEALKGQLATYELEEKKKAKTERLAELKANTQREADEALKKHMVERQRELEESKKAVQQAHADTEKAEAE